MLVYPKNGGAQCSTWLNDKRQCFKAHCTPKLPKARTRWYGRFSGRDIDRLQSEVQKKAEFQRNYDDFMDGVDDVCNGDIPQSWQKHCYRLYLNSDKIVEMYLHGFSNKEICQAVPGQCPLNMWD